MSETKDTKTPASDTKARPSEVALNALVGHCPTGRLKNILCDGEGYWSEGKTFALHIWFDGHGHGVQLKRGMTARECSQQLRNLADAIDEQDEALAALFRRLDRQPADVSNAGREHSKMASTGGNDGLQD